ncbi:MAG: phosphate/phosphite/phosphonate ABC transporter substrate-binding protein [Betaproteobacteria bacterium HGW-Betaproteobacteria-7]|jgi:phosphonate transport system substrate-binding protein|nr:MAG: phosphate/phosphite/phosphonate ABC transporter substrate-binding protein [Betaproteobacteria bacterium HGW-Betaproteobacteria-7]
MKKIIACLSGLLLLTTSPASAASCEDPRPLRFALSPVVKAEAQMAQYRPLVERLEQHLGRRVELIPAASYGSVVEGLLAGGVDLAELGPASYAMAMSRGAGIVAFASFAQRTSPLTEASTRYRSLLIVRRDAGFGRLEQLRGRTVSLTDPASTSGSVLPRLAIDELTRTPLEQFFQRVTFAGSHDRAITAVQRRLVDAAFVSSSRLDEALRRGTVAPGEIAILWQSTPIPYDPFVLRERLCPALAARIRQVFLGDTTALQGMFRELNMTGFVAAGDEDYREIRELFGSRQ